MKYTYKLSSGSRWNGNGLVVTYIFSSFYHELNEMWGPSVYACGFYNVIDEEFTSRLTVKIRDLNAIWRRTLVPQRSEAIPAVNIPCSYGIFYQTNWIEDNLLSERLMQMKLYAFEIRTSFQHQSFETGEIDSNISKCTVACVILVNHALIGWQRPLSKNNRTKYSQQQIHDKHTQKKYKWAFHWCENLVLCSLKCHIETER